jgi:sialic acid synthase SpsE
MVRSSNILKINNSIISNDSPVYFIADIAANHDGNLNRAKSLIYRAAESGANAAKFQHFQAESIVSDEGFKSLGKQLSHQSFWEKSVFDVYKDASLKLDWTQTLKEACNDCGIDFFTSPYSKEIVDYIDPYVPAYKIGSGDITWHEIIKHIASKNKPYILATGASNIKDVQVAVELALSINSQLALLQCNTNYTGDIENFRFINLNVLKTYRILYPEMILGLSDHSPGDVSVLGAISLGAKIIEKHFTDDTSRPGPDHAFSMDPVAWKDMVYRSRVLEQCLGTEIKKIEENEFDTVVLQRRSIRLAVDLQEGAKLTNDTLLVLRPCPEDAIYPYDLDKVLGRTLRKSIKKGDYLKWSDLM